MTYAKIENDKVVEYPVYEGDLRLRFRNISFPTPFQPPEGYVKVEDVAPPAYDHRKDIAEGAPLLIDGKWTRNWMVTPASADEVVARTAIKWAEVRNERNVRLRNCDWTQLGDTPISKPEWISYRQQLRDITKQTNPFAIVWPTEPSGA